MYFERDTVKSECSAQIFRKMMKYIKIKYKLLDTLTSFTVYSGVIKKKNNNNKALKMTSQSSFFSSP